MAFNSQNGFGHHNSSFNDPQAQRRLDQQLNHITSNLSNFDINNQTDSRQFNPPSGPRRGSQPKRNRSRFDPPIATRQDSNGDIELGGTRSSRPTAKQIRRARDSERRQEIIRSKASDQFKVAKTSKNHKKNAHKKAGTKNRRAEQKETLEAILADPERAQQRKLALQRVYAAAQKWHLAVTHKAELKEEVKRLTRELCNLTEKNYDELFHDLCQPHNVKAAKPLIEQDLTSGIAETSTLANALNDITTRTVRDTEAIAAYLTKSKKERDSKRNAFLSIPTPKFDANYSKTTQDTHEFKQLWKIARPLVADLKVAVDDGRDLIIAHAYAPARQPLSEISRILRRCFEEILSQVVPALSAAQIAKFEAPFLAVEEASRPKEPELPDFGDHGEEQAQHKQQHHRDRYQDLADSHGITPHQQAMMTRNYDAEWEEFGLTNECHHYTFIGDVPWDIQKYWQQRYDIWSLYDEGIYMTDDAWFGVTPEPVANSVAKDFAKFINDDSKTTIVDIFAGAGGNAIAFALSGRWEHVVAIEKNPSVIACAKNNAFIYGVLDKITWINDDCFTYMASHLSPTSEAPIDRSSTVVFASPPWGGPQYRGDKIFSLDTMEPYSAKAIHDMVKDMDCALFLPRTSDLRQIAALIPDEQERKIEVVQYCIEGASKALVAYVPAVEKA